MVPAIPLTVVAVVRAVVVTLWRRTRRSWATRFMCSMLGLSVDLRGSRRGKGEERTVGSVASSWAEGLKWCYRVLTIWLVRCKERLVATGLG